MGLIAATLKYLPSFVISCNDFISDMLLFIYVFNSFASAFSDASLGAAYSLVVCSIRVQSEVDVNAASVG